MKNVTNLWIEKLQVIHGEECRKFRNQTGPLDQKATKIHVLIKQDNQVSSH